MFFLKRNKKKINFQNNENCEDIIIFKKFNLWNESKTKHILNNISLTIKKNSIVSIIGPSGSGKSSLLRSINKSNFDYCEYIFNGEILYKNENIFQKSISKEVLRTQIGLIFQKPILFPMTIKENIVFGLKNHGIYNKRFLDQKVEKILRECMLWYELKDRLNEKVNNNLSGGQRQRLCIARAAALSPGVLLMDEPTSSLDPKSSNKIEELILKMSKYTTIIFISHSLTQVKRISEHTIFLKDGKIIEYDLTRKIFTDPKEKETRDFISGKY